MNILAGMDIGGTKCAVVLAIQEAQGLKVVAKRRFPTPGGPTATIAALTNALVALLEETGADLAAIGISCGGPLDGPAGRILSPPNLPGWDDIDMVTPFRTRFGVPVGLENDANAGALAEWYWGAGRGLSNLIFLTFGTGMGAGLILDGHLYRGTNGLAGEVGHLRLRAGGPVGFGKAGSFEGFCSGGGIARYARGEAARWIGQGRATALAHTESDIDAITAETVGKAARAGDPLALTIMETVAERLGEGLSVLVDLLNPELIVLGSIYGRQRALLEPGMRRVLEHEAIPAAYARCRIAPAGLGEAIGDMASLAVASRCAGAERKPERAHVEPREPVEEER